MVWSSGQFANCGIPCQGRDPRIAAREITALANSGGGRIVVGVDERAGPVGDPNPDGTRRLLERAAKSVGAGLTIDVFEATLDGHQLVICDVGPPPDDAPVIAPDGALVRRGPLGENVPLSGREVARAFQHAQPGVDQNERPRPRSAK
jgi:predicted HTH transcriptional regulator